MIWYSDGLSSFQTFVQCIQWLKKTNTQWKKSGKCMSFLSMQSVQTVQLQVVDVPQSIIIDWVHSLVNIVMADGGQGPTIPCSLSLEVRTNVKLYIFIQLLDPSCHFMADLGGTQNSYCFDFVYRLRLFYYFSSLFSLVLVSICLSHGLHQVWV